MKIMTKNDKPKYEPITIVLETAEDYLSVLAALGLSTRQQEVVWLTSYGIDTKNYTSEAAYLHAQLCPHFDKVKETL